MVFNHIIKCIKLMFNNAKIKNRPFEAKLITDWWALEDSNL